MSKIYQKYFCIPKPYDSTIILSSLSPTSYVVYIEDNPSLNLQLGFSLNFSECARQINYTTVANMISQNKTLPSFIDYLNETLFFKANETSQVGIYLLNIAFTFFPIPEINRTISVNINITVLSRKDSQNVTSTKDFEDQMIKQPPNLFAPFFRDNLAIIVMYVGQLVKYELPVIISYSNDTILTQIVPKLPHCATFRDQTLIMQPTWQYDVGIYYIQIILYDLNYFNLKSTYTVKLHVLITDLYRLPQPKYLNQSFPITNSVNSSLSVSSKSQIGGLNVTNAAATREGELVITFDKLINIPNPGSLNSSIVMYLRQLVDGDYVEYQVQFQYQKLIGDKAYFQVIFPNPYNVSANGVEDRLIIKFNKEYDIVSQKLNEPLLTKKTNCTVPQQFVDELLRTAYTSGSVSWYICSAIMIAAALLQCCCGMNLFLLWGVLNTLQIIVHIPMLTLLVPLNVLLVLDLSNFLVNFNFLPSGQIVSSIFNFTRDNDTVADSGDYSKVYHVRDQYSSLYFIRNVSDFLMLFFFLIFCYLLGKLKMFGNIGTQISQKVPSLKKAVDYLRNKMFYSSLIRSFQLWYLKLTISAYINYQTLTYTDTLSKVSSILDITFIGTLLAVIYFIYFFLRTKRHKFDSPSFKNKYEALYINLDTQKKNSWWFSHIFLLRRFAYMLSIVYFGNFPVVQIVVYIILSILWYSFLLSYEPMLKESQWRTTEYANETTILICGYLNLLFTEYIPDAELRYKIGWFFIIILLIDMIFNWILIVLLPIIDKLKRILKKRMEQRVKKGVYRRNPSKSLLNLQEIRSKDMVYTESKSQRSVQIKKVERVERKNIKPIREGNDISIPQSIQKFDSTLFLDSEKEDNCQVKQTKGSETIMPIKPSNIFREINHTKQKQGFIQSEEIYEEEKPSNQQSILENTLMFESAEKTLNDEVEDDNDPKVMGLTKEGLVKVDIESLPQYIEFNYEKPEKKSRVSFFFPEIDVIVMNERKRNSSFRKNEDDDFQEKRSLGFPYYTESYQNVNTANQLPYKNSKVIQANQLERSMPKVFSPLENIGNGGLSTWLSYINNASVVADVEENLEYIENKRRISRMRKGI